jgi:uncharacterized protein (DUF1501 family)
MKRRDFLKTSLPLGLFPLVSGVLPMQSVAATSAFMANPCNVTDRSMVIIYLNGGNDIVNTTVPLNQFSTYTSVRPNIYLPNNQLITLDNNLSSNQQIGLHPAMTGFKQLYDNGMLNIVQRVGYPSPNKSHFKSLENWLMGIQGGQTPARSGWLGRFMDNRYPGYEGGPFVGEPDPLAVLFGNMNDTGFHTQAEHRADINLSGQDPSGFYTLISSLSGSPIPTIPNTEHGDVLSHVSAIENSVNIYAQRISDTFNNGSNSSAAYPNSSLGNQLKTIARMLKGGSRTKIFMATRGGFDNHAYLVDGANSITGTHANNLGDVSNSIKAFQDDLDSLGLDDNVITVVFSEFGRKIIQNNNFGVDHGTLSSMFVIGKGVEGGVLGDNIDLADQDNPGAANPAQLQHDYRQVFSTILQDWFGADNDALAATFTAPSVYASKLPLINNSNIVPSSCYYTPQYPQVCACVQVRVALEGFWDAGTNEMKTDLAKGGNLPLSQPYINPPVSYAGLERITAFPADTVDWLLVELRDSNDPSIKVARQVVLLRKDGYLMGLDGTPGVSFQGVTDGDYHLAVLHRNHLPIISSDTLPVDAQNFIYDFRQGAFMAMGHEQLKDIGGTYGMIAGDIDANGIIDSRDYNTWKAQKGSAVGYHSGDLSGDGSVSNTDYDFWFGNRSKLGSVQ